jgi:hypothetical protein
MPPDRDTDETEDGVGSDAATEGETDPEGSGTTGTGRTDSAAASDAAERDEGATTGATTATVGSAEVTTLGGDSPGIEPLDRLLPGLRPDSRWWYWIAAVPVYFVLSMLLAFGGFLLVVAGVALDIPFGLVIPIVIVALIGLPGTVLSVMFPLATYADARAIAGADIEWTPDPILYGLLALTAVLITAFVLSVPLALYYLYQRHRHVGTP